MFTRLYMGIILSLLLLGGAVAAAPAASRDHHAVTAVAAAFAGEAEPASPAADRLDVGEANDNPPLLAEMAGAGAALQWGAAWRLTWETAVADILRFRPDEPPKRMA